MKTMDSRHALHISPCQGRISVLCEGLVVARSEHALWLQEGTLAPVIYIPRSDIWIEHYVRTEHRSHCPYKGDASYFSLDINAKRSPNAVWSYENPHRAAARIKGHVAFNPERVTFVSDMPQPEVHR